MASADSAPSPSRRTALAVPIVLVALMWAVEILDAILPWRLDAHGIRPRTADGLAGILFAPVLHDDWGHLIANSVPMLVLGFLLALSGMRVLASVTAIVWLAGGAAVWLVAGSNTNHLGASGLVFGWIAYLVVRGLFTRRIGQILLGVIVFAVYGAVLWGVLPGQPGVSWQGHLFGAAAGVLAAWLVHDDRRRAVSREAA